MGDYADIDSAKNDFEAMFEAQENHAAELNVDCSIYFKGLCAWDFLSNIDPDYLLGFDMRVLENCHAASYEILHVMLAEVNHAGMHYTNLVDWIGANQETNIVPFDRNKMN